MSTPSPLTREDVEDDPTWATMLPDAYYSRLSALLDERDGYKIQLEGVKALAVEAEKAHAAEVATLKTERDEARNAVQVASDVAVTAACAAIEAERDDAYAQRDHAKAEFQIANEQLSEMGRQRDLAIQQAIDEETKHRKWTDDRELLAKDLAAARAERDLNLDAMDNLARKLTEAEAELAKMTALKTAACDEANGLAEELHAARATAAQHEKALEAMRAEYDGYREEARRHGDELRARCAMLASAVDRDKTGLGAALNAIISHVKSYTWLLEGRGSYEWDDDRYREEAGHAMRPVIEIAEKALGASGTLAYRTLTAPGDAGVATWLEGVKAEARLAGAQAVLPTLSDEASRALAAHDAQVEAKTLEKAAQHVELNWTFDRPEGGYTRTPNGDRARRIAAELRSLASKDGTTP